MAFRLFLLLLLCVCTHTLQGKERKQRRKTSRPTNILLTLMERNNESCSDNPEHIYKSLTSVTKTKKKLNSNKKKLKFHANEEEKVSSTKITTVSYKKKKVIESAIMETVQELSDTDTVDKSQNANNEIISKIKIEKGPSKKKKVIESAIMETVQELSDTYTGDKSQNANNEIISQIKIEKGPSKKKQLKEPDTMEILNELSDTDTACKSHNTYNEITTQIKVKKGPSKKKKDIEPKTVKELSNTDAVIKLNNIDDGNTPQIKTKKGASKTERERKLAIAKIAKELSDYRDINEKNDDGDLKTQKPLSTIKKHHNFVPSTRTSELSYMPPKVQQKIPEVTNTLYNEILEGLIPINFLYEDNQTVAFFEKRRVTPIHFIVMPRRLIKMLSITNDSDEQLLGHLLVVARTVAEHLGLEKNGYRVVINNGRDAQQLVQQLHLHVLGGRKMKWPPG